MSYDLNHGAINLLVPIFSENMRQKAEFFAVAPVDVGKIAYQSRPLPFHYCTETRWGKTGTKTGWIGDSGPQGQQH